MWRDKQDEKCANHRSRLDQIDAALAGRRPAVGCRRRRHTFGVTWGCDERRHLTVTVATAADVDGAREIPERALPPRHRIPSLPAATHRVFKDPFVRCQDRGRGAEGGCYQKAVERGVMHRQFGWAIPPTMRWPFAEGDIDNHGRFEPLAADMKPYGSRADNDAACAPVLPPDAGRLLHGTARTYANTLQVRDAAGAFRNRVAGVRGRRHRLELVGSVRRSGLRRRPRPVRGQRHGRRGVRVPTRRGAAVDRLANAKADKPAVDAVAGRVEVLEVSSSAFARSGRPPAMSGSKPRGPRGPRHTL